MKRRIAMMLAVMCLMLSFSTVSYAAEGDNAARVSAAGETGGIQPYYINTATITAGLKIEGNTAYCYTEVVAKSVCFINVKMRLQQNVNGIWKTRVSWISSANAGGKVVSESFTLTDRGSYRVYALCTVGGEEVTCISSTKTY